MRKVTIFALVLIVFLGGALYSCNGFEDQDLELQSTELTEEAQQLKELYQTEMLKMSELMESRTNTNIPESESQQLIKALAEPTVKMLKSYGFTDKDWKEFKGTEDPQFICLGLMFLAVADSNTKTQSFSLIKSRSLENGNEGDCWTFDNIKECIVKSIAPDDLVDLAELAGLLSGCMAKEVVFTTLKQFLKKCLPPTVGLTVIIMEFAKCMSEKG